MRAEGALWDAIEDFTRNCLGCDCPAEVFQHIDCNQGEEAPEAPNGLRPVRRLDIGGRLLVYIAEAAGGDGQKEALATALGELAGAGIKDRDSEGFNRFRLVIACPKPESHEDDLKRSFRLGPAGDDPKAHLHVVSKDDPRLVAVLGHF